MPRQANRFGGGANTNRNGLHFEQTTSLNTALQNAGFIIANHFEVYDRNQLLGYSINQDEFSTIFLRQNGINDRAINSKRWKPDEAFINEIDKTVYIIEKNFQRTSGSVDEKLATFPFKIREYRRLLDPIGYDLVYIYLLSSDWFNVPKYQDYYDYISDSIQKSLHLFICQSLTLLLRNTATFCCQINRWVMVNDPAFHRCAKDRLVKDHHRFINRCRFLGNRNKGKLNIIQTNLSHPFISQFRYNMPPDL